MPIVIIGIATIVVIVVESATVLELADGTPANNMAKDYLMRTFRFTLLLN